MQRRQFQRAALALAVAASLGGAGAAAAQQAAPGVPVEGRDYRRLAQPLPLPIAAGKAEVVEFFGYWCPHCAALEPQIAAWSAKQPANVTLRRVPVAFAARDEALARLYHAIDMAGVTSSLHAKVFQAVHEQRVPMRSDDDVLAWLKTQGADGAKAAGMLKSFAVATRVKQSAQLAQAVPIQSVPTLIVQDRYEVTSSPTALATVDALVAQALAGR